MIWLGLLKYCYNDAAERIRQGIFELVANHGFREYYDPFTGRGLGGKPCHTVAWVSFIIPSVLHHTTQYLYTFLWYDLLKGIKMIRRMVSFSYILSFNFGY